LPAFSAGVARLVGGPFVRRPLFMRRATAFAGDLALLFRGHRRETSSFFPFSCIHYSALR
jgi:hypothetical protein